MKGERLAARPLRIANCSGFYGDRLSAAREMVEGGPIDVLTGDYLAEITTLILYRLKAKDPEGGYARTFLRQMEEVLGLALDRGIRIVSNAGGLNPAALARRLGELAARLGLHLRIARVEGDDLTASLGALQSAGHRLEHMDTGIPFDATGATAVAANAYLGGWGIAEALAAGADVVVTGRVSDASLVVGPAAWRFGWARDDWDRLASAVVAGHILECGPQATGGNYAFFREVPGLRHPGFPIAEIEADGSFTVTKHEGHGGLVSVGTVTAQLLYEIEGARYPNPDVVARFDTIRLEQEAPDRVRVSGVRGEPAPGTAKVAIMYLGGFWNTMTFVATGLDIEGKAALFADSVRHRFEGRLGSLVVQVLRTDKPDAPTNEEASALVRVIAKDPDPGAVGRAFSGGLLEMMLSSYPGFYPITRPAEAEPYGVYWPARVPSEVVEHRVVLPDGSDARIAPPSGRGFERIEPAPASAAAGVAVAPRGPTERVPLGAAFGARSGDKGGNANVGVWARDDAGYAWLSEFLTVGRFKDLVSEAARLEVRRHDLPNLRALNFFVAGLLGEGATSSIRFDRQAKSLGEYLRSRVVDMPVALLDDAPR